MPSSGVNSVTSSVSLLVIWLDQVDKTVVVLITVWAFNAVSLFLGVMDTCGWKLYLLLFCSGFGFIR